MAYTSSFLADASFGSERARIFRVSSDGASGYIDSGLNSVKAALLTYKSCTTSAFSVHINKSATGTVANGKVAFASAAATDTFDIVCIGG